MICWNAATVAAHERELGRALNAVAIQPRGEYARVLAGHTDAETARVLLPIVLAIPDDDEERYIGVDGAGTLRVSGLTATALAVFPCNVRNPIGVNIYRSGAQDPVHALTLVIRRSRKAVRA